MLTWSLYKQEPDSSPEQRHRAEFYQYRMGTAPLVTSERWVPKEVHGWFSMDEERAVHTVTTLCPEAGRSFQEAWSMLDAALRKRVGEGFVQLFGLDPYIERVHLLVSPTDTLYTIESRIDQLRRD